MPRETPRELTRVGAHALLHVTVLLWGLTAILGRQISIAAIPLVWYRILFVIVALAVWLPVRGISFRAPAGMARRYAGVGALIGLHWLCFYAAVKYAGISTAVLTLSTIAFFTACIEPIVFRRRVAVAELVLGVVVVFGVALLLRVEVHSDAFGLGLGFASALFSAWFGVLNGQLARAERAERLLFYEMVAGLATVTVVFVAWPSAFVAPWQLSLADLGWLAVLALVCTVLAQLWALRVLRVLPPFTVAMSTNLEPVYSIAFAAVLYPQEEALSLRFYVGAAFLLGLVAINALRRTPPA